MLGFAVLLALAPLDRALAWGQEGHSIIAEIAQRRRDSDTLGEVKALLGREISLASVASWTDDHQALHPDTGGGANFVNILFDQSAHDPARDYKPDNGDYNIHALARFQQRSAIAPSP
jgi:hypothetical protein